MRSNNPPARRRSAAVPSDRILVVEDGRIVTCPSTSLTGTSA